MRKAKSRWHRSADRTNVQEQSGWEEKSFWEVHLGEKERSSLYLEKDVFTQQISHYNTSLLLSGEGGADWQAEREGGSERANHFCVCQVKEVLTGWKKLRVIRAGEEEKAALTRERVVRKKKWGWGIEVCAGKKRGGGRRVSCFHGWKVRLTDLTKHPQRALPLVHYSQVDRVRRNV